MKLKYYLRGMGVGMIVTTVILMIVFSLHKNETLTDDEIRTRARALGMVEADAAGGSEKLSDPSEDEQTDPPQDDLTDTTPESKPADTKTQPDSTSDAKEKTQTQQDKTSASEAAKPETETVEQVELSIVGGEYSDDVCKKLKRAGVIKDADDFNKYLSEGGYDSLIQPGTYIIPKDADYDTIIRLITEKKTTETKDAEKETGKKTQKNKKKS